MPIVRDPVGAEREAYDLIIIGGGVQGASLALESAARGLRSLLLERDDFGSGTSAQTLRILHGGFRYLQSLDLVRFRESVRQRRWWMRTFPELVGPLACLLPLYNEGVRHQAVLGPALVLNDLLSSDRNQGVAESSGIPSSRLVTRREALDLFPAARRRGLAGAALWHDASMSSPHRLLIEMLRWATEGGAVALNYVEALRPLISGSEVIGIVAHDRVAGGELRYRAPLVVNAAGPWTPSVAEGAGAVSRGLFEPSLAFNLLLDWPAPANLAVAVHRSGPSNPIYFLRPHGGRSLVGTAHLPWEKAGDPPDHLPEDAVARFLAELRESVPGFEVYPRHVVTASWGLLPAAAKGSSSTARRPVILDHARQGGPRGLWSVSGVKFTTAPAVAKRTLDAALRSRAGLGKGTALPPRPEPRPIVSPRSFLELHERDPAKAGLLIGTLWEEEAVVHSEDLYLRRLDWGLDSGDDFRAARDVIDRLLPGLGGRSS